MLRLAPLVLLLVLAACATPVAPTGGPVDTTPPSLVEVSPADGTTNVSDPTVVLTFSERLSSRSGSAVTVTPAGDVPVEVSIRGRDITLRIPELRDSTTYVVTVGTELQDQRNVALRSPITVAFSTGDEIDAGRLSGLIRDPRTGQGVGSMAVWAYALAGTTMRPDPREIAPDYRTESDAGGAFTLQYLRPGPYFVVAVADRNRNGRADAGERFAAPSQTVLRADTTTADVPPTFWATTRDTIPPTAQRVRAISDRRFALRFSEPVSLADRADVSLADSASGAPVDSITVYQPPDSAFEILVETPDPLPQRRLVLRGGAGLAADSAGLGAPFAVPFTPSERPDTLLARFESFVPTRLDSLGTLTRGTSPGVRFSAPPGELPQRLALVVDNDRQMANVSTADGVTYTLSGDLPDAPFALEWARADTTSRQRYRVPDPRDVGSIVGQVTSDSPVFAEVRQQGEAPIVVAVDDGSLVVDGLLPGPYLVRLWADENGDGVWTGGSLAPYAPPEPLVLLAEPIDVRARWETEIDPITL